MKYQLAVEGIDPGAVTLLVRDVRETLSNPDMGLVEADLHMELDLDPEQAQRLNRHLADGFWGHTLKPIEENTSNEG
jgi:hypothetical protein